MTIAAHSADAFGDREAVAPADPPCMVAAAGTPEYRRTAAAPGGWASTPQDEKTNLATAGHGGGEALQAPPAKAALPAVARKMRGPGRRAAPAVGDIP